MNSCYRYKQNGATEEIEMKNINTTNVTRIEVISEDGRILTNYGIKIDDVVLQDEGKTVKIFISRRKRDDPLSEDYGM